LEYIEKLLQKKIKIHENAYSFSPVIACKVWPEIKKGIKKNISVPFFSKINQPITKCTYCVGWWYRESE